MMAAGLVPLVAQAASVGQRFCNVQTPLQAPQLDRLLRFAAIAKDALQASGAEVALMARSGLNLGRFGVRYSHAGIALRQGGLGAWSVRQLYYACDEGRPQVFDQGLAGFVSGTEDPDSGYLSAVLLPAAAAQTLQQAALDKPRAVGLLAARYSANAYAHSLRYQNCNQWLVELLAVAWGDLRVDPVRPALRSQAQQWLATQGYEPEGVDVGSHMLMAVAPLIPWIHLDDHPESDRFALRLRTSLPADIERLVRRIEPQAQRIELCHAAGRVVLRRGWTPIAPGCLAEPGDRVYLLDSTGAAPVTLTP